MKDRQRDFDARVGFVDLFVQVSFNDAIVVQAEPLADRILGDLQPAIEVASQGGSKKESDSERERSRLKAILQGDSSGGLGQCQPYLPADIGFIHASGRGKQTTSIHRRILMVDAGRDGQRDLERIRCDDRTMRWYPKCSRWIRWISL